MIKNKIANRIIAICLVILFLINLNSFYKVSAEWNQLTDDGITYDTFENSDDITLTNCNLTDGAIILKEGKDIIKYNCIQAWEVSSLFTNPSEGLGKIIYQFSKNFFWSSELDNNDIEKLKQPNDNNIVSTDLPPWGPETEPSWPMHHFRFKINTSRNNIDSFKIIWRSGDYHNDANLEEISMYVWSYGDYIPRWNRFDSFLYTEDQFSTVDGYLSSVINNIDFISIEDSFIDVLIIGNPKDNDKNTILDSDFIEIDIKIKEGYLQDGNVKSSIIPKNNFYGWEKIIWEGTKPTKYTSIKLFIQDENGKNITSLDGNEQGFTDSPIDISMLDPILYKNIIIYAELHSDNLEYTPVLYSWAVLWQTKTGFYDSFNYSYRVEEASGVNFVDGDVIINKFFSNWPIFGKNPSNTRSYSGVNTSFNKNETYWRTNKSDDVGGYFLSPIVDNGKVYIGSNDSRIYVLNLTADINEKYQLIYDTSTYGFNIDESVAVSNDYIVFGTSLRNYVNKIYALDKSDLSIVWTYIFNGNDNNICYSSSPTISNDRVFITSWNGWYGNNKLISYLYSQLNKILGYKLELNNLLIALDINSGKVLWNPINLPAASYCKPAVNDNIIYVGCDSFKEPSFFAIDEDSGLEIWNSSIGLLGRTSPVVADGKVFITARNQSLFSLKGNDIVYAFNAKSGEMLWNFTIAENNSANPNLLLNYLQKYGMKEDLIVSSFTASPSYYNNRLFVLSSNGILYALNADNGSVEWKFNISQDSLSKFYSCLSSPIVVNNIVYIISSEDGIIYALDNLNDGNILWEANLEYSDYGSPIQGHKIYSSPVVTDNLILISELRNVNFGNYTGRITCIGDYKTNSYGNVLSIPIHVQKGKWWNTFKASFTNTAHNKITFSILDEKGNPFSQMNNLNGNYNNISGIKNNVIQLSANFNSVNTSEKRPVLNSWEISWLDEGLSPRFINESFKPSQEGWISLYIKNCSIKVIDYGKKITSGLDINSAKFKLEYLKDNKTFIESFNASCDGINGAIETTITANLSELGINVNFMKNITFSIKDLAGNEATSNKIKFKIDSTKPSSQIINGYNDKYTNTVTITAQGNDDLSGIASLSLYYRVKDEEDWKIYGSENNVTPYIWKFNTNISNYYEFCTIAKDKAGNTQDFPDSGEISFLFDENPPYKPVFNESYSFKTLPEFSIGFIDDFQLKSVEYKLNLQGLNDWITIEDDINLKNYTGKWALPLNDWNSMEEDIPCFIYFKLTDLCGNIYETQSDGNALMIIKDELYPILNVNLDLSDFEGGGMKDEYIISTTVPGYINTSYVVLEYSYSLDKNDWSNWKEFGKNISESPYDWKFKTDEGSGFYKFKVKIFDEEGRAYESPIKIVNVTEPATSHLIILMVLIIIFIFTSYIIFKKFKNNKV